MTIVLDPDSDQPLHRQIEQWYRGAISRGPLAPGTRLPAARTLAEELGVSRTTVDRAYGTLLAEGLLETRGSGGTVVANRPALVASSSPRPRWQQALLESRPPRSGAPMVPPSVIDLSGGLAGPDLFDWPGFSRALNTVRLREGVQALDHGDPRGFGPLREVIAGILGAQGLPTDPGSILVTAGSQQALTLVASCLLQPGDGVWVERPTYNSVLDLFRALGLTIVDDPDLAGVLERREARLIYTMPTHQNPTGRVLDREGRQALLELAVRYDVPILEDDFAGDVRFEGRGHPTLKALDRTGHVLYVGSFSKMLLPGLRTGYLVLEGPVFDLLAEHKRVTDLSSATLVQRALAEYIGVGRYQTHLKRLVRLARRRRDTVVAELGKAKRLRWSAPPGGFFLWLEAPEAIDLATTALAAGVRLAPGSSFFADPTQGLRFARLNFAGAPETDLIEAARRLVAALE